MDLILPFALAALAVAAVLLVPRRVHYVEEVLIAAPLERVRACVLHQRDLMRWSAWPSATGATCALENEDGRPGARTVYLRDGERVGHQEVTAASDDEVVLEITSPGPPQRPRLTFTFEALGPERTRVRLRFDNEIARPFNLLLRLIGVVRWTRALHVKDLDGLRRYAEPPQGTHLGRPATPGAA